MPLSCSLPHPLFFFSCTLRPVPGEYLALGIQSIHASPRLSILITSDSPLTPPICQLPLYCIKFGSEKVSPNISLVCTHTDSNRVHILYVFINKAVCIYRPLSMTDLYKEIMGGFTDKKKKSKALKLLTQNKIKYQISSATNPLIGDACYLSEN